MGLIREPLDVDFEFDPRPLTDKEKEEISNYIKAYKAKNAKKKSSINLDKNSVSGRR
jgi:hypothetical protein